MISIECLNENYPDKIIEKLIKEDGMTDIDALEHYTYNIEGSKGEGFPIYIRTKL